MSWTSKALLRSLFLPALILLVGMLGCERGYKAAGAPKPAATSQPVEADVRIDNFSFNPPTITVRAGTTVRWVNHDDVPHTVTANDRRFASKSLDTDDRFSQRFTATGTYPYFCAVHPHMTGQVVVKE